MTRIKTRHDGLFNVYVPLGYPDLETSEALAVAALENGADGLELGLPFSDPAADGPTIEAATQRALQNGTTVADCLEIASRLRRRFPDAPLVAMTYANLAFRPGWAAFANALAEAGVDGLILPDVSLEESKSIRAALHDAGVAWVPLVSPLTPPDRMAAIAATATGFLYVVGSTGITGQEGPGPLVERTVQAARAAGAKVPLLVGFGIASPEDVRRILDAGADGAIVGSHLVRIEDPEAYAQEVRRLCTAR
ncbi:MAG: tryptophan synthase subunit alpha [Thermoplasmatota archaeon]